MLDFPFNKAIIRFLIRSFLKDVVWAQHQSYELLYSQERSCVIKHRCEL